MNEADTRAAVMWETVKLDEIVSLSMGKTPSRGNAKFWDKEKISKNIWLSIADLSALDGLYIEDSKEYVSDEGAKLIKTVPSETLVMSFKLSIGKLAITKCELRTNEAIAALPIKDEKLITKEYLYYFLSSINWDALAGNDVKVKGKTLNKAKLKEIPISYPPLAEQQRIVAKLDTAFAEIERAIETAAKNIQNSKHFYSHAIDREFSKYSKETESIGEHSKVNYGYTAKASFEKGKYKFLRITDIQNNAVDWNSVPYCEVEPKKLPGVLLKDGDIVFARTGATTGKSFLVENPIDAVFASYLIRVSVDRGVLLPKYVMHFLQSAAYWQQVDEGISGAAQEGFNASKLSGLKIPIINKTKQLELIQSLDLINEQSANLQITYALKMQALNSLKSAILAQELQSEAA